MLSVQYGSISSAAQRHLVNSSAAQAQASERISSGKRINHSADDAAGLSIVSTMNTVVNGTQQAMKNVNDGISVAQTIDVSLDGVSDILQRMRELSVYSGNGTLSQGQLSMLNEEMSQLKLELSSIAKGARFNGHALLDGTFNKEIMVGDDGEKISLAMPAAFGADNLPPKDVQGANLNAVLGNFVNEDGERIPLTIEGVSLSYLATGTADQAGNATALYNALNTEPVKTQLDNKGISSVNRGESVEILRSTAVVTPLKIQMGTATDEDKVNSLTVSNFDNLIGDVAAFDLSGVAINFTGAGTDQAANALSLEAALNANSVALAERGISWVNHGSSITISQQDSSATIPVDELKITMLTGGVGESNFTTTSNYGLVGGTEAPGDSRVLTDGPRMKVSNFTNTAGETIRFRIYPANTYVSFEAKGTADQAGNAAAMAAAINAANIPDAKAVAEGGVVHINSTGQDLGASGHRLLIDTYSGSDAEGARFHVEGGEHSSLYQGSG